MELNSFRIIAVRVFSYCDPAIMRALYPETTYFLNNDYEDVYEWNGKWNRGTGTCFTEKLSQ